MSQPIARSVGDLDAGATGGDHSLEVVLRNIAAGSLCRQTPIAEGTAIAPALLDLYYKDDALGDPC